MGVNMESVQGMRDEEARLLLRFFRSLLPDSSPRLNCEVPAIKCNPVKLSPLEYSCYESLKQSSA